ncbi:L-rhamnose mutarotase [Rhodococcus sp. BP-252]|uniref:L-rhamnose mutarotase n=1 Tax=unclassified Rhodococcus (in: high G+C Gram-positive bacteria) TaxID=192944 RepID=UPI001C9A57FB|nr:MULTISPECIES: L-rhamnose mutarotase [unclassified Rhodococcus (in: high G+C Gram-positive bacteria)]MBY6414551.1 L-rhamnose mutarotase [Rhodococcus sp. BP-320]MBY6419540.1 L-rhamnose mutarotase [Rhodococcus sp. BP-321]MBY6424218.1 L-rhamnose mutarotase [Rhodococcus sp. BP-324]MBY6429553.1 L-rhamnose mutarotase [Rhodococcus sp. BP-323]MBY6434382.1 L-rhamnose mutarotase [Rhodococcus sp. BP-322]
MTTVADADNAELHRVCFLLKLRPDRVQDYLAAHEHVWPDMLDALRDTGWKNYSLFLRPEDGLVVGYVESKDPAAMTAAMSATDVDARWQRNMAEYFEPAARPDAPLEFLTHYFHLT